MVAPPWDGGFSRFAAADKSVLHPSSTKSCGLTPRNVRDLDSRLPTRIEAENRSFNDDWSVGLGLGKKGCVAA
jgi:hypothetical protein